MIWFTSDTHFGHGAMIEHVGRPFADVSAMDNAMVALWNAVVAPRDVVWHLGDFSIGRSGTAAKYFRRLNGSKHLVRGNHDGDDVSSCSWASVHDVASQKFDGVKFTLYHYPMLSWPGSAHNRHGVVRSVMCHGHVHGTRTNPRVPHVTPYRIDVGVDMWAYAPVSAEALLARLRETVHEAEG